MSNNADDPGKIRWWPFWLILSFAVIFWFSLVIEWFPGWIEESKRGAFGDSFGVVNALFSGLAFAGVIFAILLQKKELELQSSAIEEQKETLQRQNFESFFFQLLNMHGEIVNSIQIQGDREYSRRECFGYLSRYLKSRLEIAIAQNRPKIEVFNATYEEELFSRFQPFVGHYFRHLYNVVKFVHEHEFFDEKEFTEKKRYTNLIRAQLSSDELGLLFYNCLSDRGAKFKDLVEKYALFEDMPSEVFIDPEDKECYDSSAYGEPD